jgi:hypothetical protein
MHQSCEALLLQRKACHPTMRRRAGAGRGCKKWLSVSGHGPCQDLSKFAADRPDWNPLRGSPVKGPEKPKRVKDMKRTVLALTTAVTIGMTALTATSPAEARWRGGGWGPGLAAGLVGAAVIGGIASSAYAYGPGYGYYGGYPSYGYYGGYAPGYYYGGNASRPYGYGGYGYRSPADDDGFGSGGYYSRW